MLWSQSVEHVRVAKKGGFFSNWGGCISGTKRGRKSRFVPFNRSGRLYMHGDFYVNQLVQLRARVTLRRKQPKFKHTRNNLKRCSALTAQDRKKCYCDKIVGQEILHRKCCLRFALKLIV